MTTHYEDRCSVDGCPEPNSEEWHRCFVCGKQAVDHHHFPSRAQAGKGAKVVAVLCRYHHDRITLHEWREGVYTHPDGSVRYYVQNQRGEQQCERIIEAAPEKEKVTPLVTTVAVGEDISKTQRDEIAAYLEEHKDDPEEWEDEPTPAIVSPAVKKETRPDPAFTDDGGWPHFKPSAAYLDESTDLAAYSDEQLATLFAWADKQQKDSFLIKCQIIHAYRERHVRAWGESWVEQAYDLFDGSPSRRTLEAYANIWSCVGADAHLLEHIGPLTDSRNLMQYIGRKNVEDGRLALEAAVAHVAQFGEAPTVPALAQKLGEEAKPELCPKTGLPHNWERVCKDCKERKS